MTVGRCPKCRRISTLDADQLAGKVSIVCSWPRCDFHGYVDQVELLREKPKPCSTP